MPASSGLLERTPMRFFTTPDGRRVATLGVGTWTVGNTPDDRYFDAIRLRIVLEELVKVCDVVYIDTAFFYGDGRAEEIIRTAMVGIDRSKLFIATKTRALPGDIAAAFDASCERLGTVPDQFSPHIFEHPPDEFFLSDFRSMLQEFVDVANAHPGLYLGVSNIDADLLVVAHQIAGDRLLTNQVHYSLSVCGPEQFKILETCRDLGMVLMAYRPFWTSWEERATLGMIGEHAAPDSSIATVARDHEMNPVDVSLAWLLNQKDVAAIPMTFSLRNMQRNIETAQVVLSPGEMTALTNEHQPHSRGSDVPLAGIPPGVSRGAFLL